ncbi:maleylpyruvate isomerase N-terminal domain-containing protein [candidate division WWE3 bacterium]|uniref:Maleylpyruvate isomerase N-terminal domain-containing protein n=1 Tax=candidate division WWE3 bacterium TaxID=2053526 RepID=A0A955RPM7_UNCKA|nr:maleylpyruvate isomerase N-terminal domain-containing protein [candidate division WWE3 bacterium]
MLIDKDTEIQNLKKAHEEMQMVLQSLNSDQKTTILIHDTWTVKDIIAHLAAWNWEVITEIERILEDGATWDKLYTEAETEDDFNKRMIEQRRHHTLPEVVEEWENSFADLLATIEQLSEEQWTHQSGQDVWSSPPLEGEPITVYSLFDYHYKEKHHEAGHAKEILEYFSSSVTPEG